MRPVRLRSPYGNPASGRRRRRVPHFACHPIAGPRALTKLIRLNEATHRFAPLEGVSVVRPTSPVAVAPTQRTSDQKDGAKSRRIQTRQRCFTRNQTPTFRFTQPVLLDFQKPSAKASAERPSNRGWLTLWTPHATTERHAATHRQHGGQPEPLELTSFCSECAPTWPAASVPSPRRIPYAGMERGPAPPPNRLAAAIIGPGHSPRLPVPKLTPSAACHHRHLGISDAMDLHHHPPSKMPC